MSTKKRWEHLAIRSFTRMAICPTDLPSLESSVTIRVSLGVIKHLDKILWQISSKCLITPILVVWYFQISFYIFWDRLQEKKIKVSFQTFVKLKIIQLKQVNKSKNIYLDLLWGVMRGVLGGIENSFWKKHLLNPWLSRAFVAVFFAWLHLPIL